MTTLQDLLNRQKKFLNVDKYHEQGFTGKGFIVLIQRVGKVSMGK